MPQWRCSHRPCAALLLSRGSPGTKRLQVQRAGAMAIVVPLVLVSLSQLACAQIDLFLATRDQNTLSRQPSQYESIDRKMPADTAPETIYVHKQPLLRISFEEVEAVNIESRRIYSDPATAVDEARKFGASGDPGKNGDRYYVATFQLSDTAQQGVDAVLRKYS